MERQFFVVWLLFSSLKIFVEPAVPQTDIDIYSLNVDCKVTSRYAHTVITSRIVNRADESKEALFEVELPKTAFITNFSMIIDGQTYPGIIKEKKSAQDQYDAAVSQGQSAGLVKSTGRKLEQFHVSVNVAAAGKVTFELVYEELLKRKLGKYELLMKVKPKQLVNHFQIDVHIFEPQGISFLEIDSTFMTNELNDALTKVQNETKAHISFKPTITQQRKNPELEETLLDGDFLIRYDVKRSPTAGDIQIVNGYFVHYFAPSEMPTFPKNVIFVIDKSGSMSGKKIKQTKEALKKILDDLNPEDHFNLVVFSGQVTEWQPSLLKATEENVLLAKRHIDTINANGVTDINDALLTAINGLNKATTAELLPEQSISMIILLTDGQPTAGVTDIGRIQKNIKKVNNGKYFLYCLGFGFDVSYTFLEKMALENGGLVRRIYEDSDAALQLQGFYHEVATPILKSIELKYPDNATMEITQNNFNVLFNGSEIVVAGKLDNEIDVFPVEIMAKSHATELILKEDADVREKEQVFKDQKYIFGNFIERLWAYLTIQQLLEKSAAAEGEQRRELEGLALNLSLKFSFVTPLTSLVVTKPEAQEVANKPTEADNENFMTGGALRLTGQRNPSQRNKGRQYDPQTSGLYLNYRRGSFPPHLNPLMESSPSIAGLVPDGLVLHSAVDDDMGGGMPTRVVTIVEHPHFILQLPSEGNPICINIRGQLQTPVTLLSDPGKGIQVTGKLGENGQFVEFVITYQALNVQITMSTREIVLNNQSNVSSFPWTKDVFLTPNGLSFTIEKEKSLSLFVPDSITIKVAYVQSPNFLGLYFKNTDLFSDRTTGLLGQFYFNTHFERPGGLSRRKKLIVQGQSYDVIRQFKKDYRIESGIGTTTNCWVLNMDS